MGQRGGGFLILGMGMTGLVACSGFGSAPPTSTGDGGSEAGTTTTRDAASDPPDWDGACFPGAFCDSFDNRALEARYEIVKTDGSVSVGDDPGWEASSGTKLHALVGEGTGPKAAYVRRTVDLGSRFGVAFRMGVDDHPSGAIAGPRLSPPGVEGTVNTLGILLSNQIAVQQTGTGDKKEITDLGTLERRRWHDIVLEVRRTPSAPGGFGWIRATLDGVPKMIPLATPLAAGDLRVGITRGVDGLSTTLEVDQLVFFSVP